MEPLVVYTTVCGGFLELIRPPAAPADPAGRPVRFVCFSDGLTVVPRPWELRPLAWERRADPRRTSRFHKLMSHALFPEAQITLWHDASHSLIENPWALVDRYLPGSCDLATFRHPLRQCVYRELAACVHLEKDDPNVMRRQISRYLEQGYPPDHGLTENTILLRRHSPLIRTFNRYWWWQVRTGSCRDQLSFNYVAWRLHAEARIGYLPGSRDYCPYFHCDWQGPQQRAAARIARVMV